MRLPGVLIVLNMMIALMVLMALAKLMVLMVLMVRMAKMVLMMLIVPVIDRLASRSCGRIVFREVSTLELAGTKCKHHSTSLPLQTLV